MDDSALEKPGQRRRKGNENKRTDCVRDDCRGGVGDVKQLQGGMVMKGVHVHVCM